MLKKCAALLFSSLLLLTSCHSKLYNQTEANIADVKLGEQAARQMSDRKAQKAPALVLNKGLYVDRTPISLAKNPTWLRNHVVIRGDQLPFSYYSRTIARGAGGHILTKYQTDLNQALTISVNYSGTMRGALDLLAAKTGYIYTVSCNTIYWRAFVTKTFQVAFMPGGTDYLLGKPEGSTANTANTSAQGAQGSVSNYVSSDASADEYSSLKGSLSIWRDITATIKQLISKEGQFNVSESTTSVTVRDRPNNVSLIGQYIANLNHNLSKQVLVKIQILETELQNDYNYGINWQLITKAFHNSPFILNASYGTPVSITSLTTQMASALTGSVPAVPQFGTQGNGKVPSYTILFNALNQQGKTSVVTEPRTLCMNNQVSVVRIAREEGYVASIQNTSLAGSGSTGGTNNLGTVTSQVTPGSVITGLTLYILPKILGDRIYLQVNADLSNNNGFTVFGPTNSQVQLPNITLKHFNQRSVIHSGDTLILSGFRQLTNQSGAMQFLKSQTLGGKAAAQINRETIVLITPFILPGTA